MIRITPGPDFFPLALILPIAEVPLQTALLVSRMKQKASYDGENIPLDAKVRRLVPNPATRRIQQQCVIPVRAQCYAEMFISPSLFRQDLILPVRKKE